MIKSKKEKLEKEKLKEELQNTELADESKNEDINIEIEDAENKPDKVSELEKQVNYYKDLFLRKAAEFENYKKRTESEISNVYRYANEGLILELLPVHDDFTRVKKSWDKNHDVESFKKGIELVYDKFVTILEKQGLKEMDALNRQFDVNLHDALMQAPSKDAEPNTVTGIIENGYYLKDKVIRHAKVIVSAAAEDENPE